MPRRQTTPKKTRETTRPTKPTAAGKERGEHARVPGAPRLYQRV
jgi:hypothetical protein